MFKRFCLCIAILLISCMLIPSLGWAAGTVTQTIQQTGKGVFEVTFVCVGDASLGTIPDTETADNDADGKTLNGKIHGGYLYSVTAFPTSGGTAPDAASLFIRDKNSLYLLGSEDGGTTAYDGLNLIHATLARKAKPNVYIPRAGLHLYDYPKVTGPLTIDVEDQATVSAEWTIVLLVITKEQ
ncbi:MAG: hypothetical protein KAT70_06065 [Thermoplasmata archaeon]|nr:hypothetical protein [Thermoplasmata archaeon]